MSQFNQPYTEKKNCVWTTKFQKLLEMCIVQHVEKKIVFTFQPIKRLVSATVKSAKTAATFWIFLSRTKTDNYVLWRWWYTLFCKKNDSWLQKRTAISFFEQISPPITTKHIRAWTKKSTSFSNYGIIVSTTHWLIESIKTSFTLIFNTLSVYSKAIWSSQPPTALLSDLLTLEQIQWLWV